MGCVSWIVFGLIAGALARLIMPGRDPGGFLFTIVVGVIGAVVGGYLATLLGYGTVNGFNLYSFGIAVAGSVLLLLLARALKR